MDRDERSYIIGTNSKDVQAERAQRAGFTGYTQDNTMHGCFLAVNWKIYTSSFWDTCRYRVSDKFAFLQGEVETTRIQLDLR